MYVEVDIGETAPQTVDSGLVSSLSSSRKDNLESG